MAFLFGDKSIFLLFFCPATSNKTKQLKPVPPPLSLAETTGGMDKLTELAIIATGPQSPLMQKPHPPPWDAKPG